MGAGFSGAMIAAAMAALLPILSPTGVAAQPLAGDNMIVPGVRIGAAELAPADQGALLRQLGEPNQTERHGDHEYYRYGTEAEPDALVVDFDLLKDEPFEISTTSSDYRTRDGLAVGSSEQAVKDRLGSPLCAGAGLMVYDTIWFLTAHGIVTRISIRQHMREGDFKTGAAHC